MTEFNINFKILFNGKIKIFPRIKRKKMQAKKVIAILKFMFMNHSFLYKYMRACIKYARQVDGFKNFILK